MKYLNFYFVVEMIRNVEKDYNVFYLRTQDGRILDLNESCDFTKTLDAFVEKLSNSKDVHEQ